jgi:hypothetical protein
MGTSPDWFLCEDVAALDAIVERLGPGAEVHLSSVWDLKKLASAVVFRIIKQAGAADRARVSPKIRTRFEPPYERVTGWSPVPPIGERGKCPLEYVER